MELKMVCLYCESKNLQENKRWRYKEKNTIYNNEFIELFCKDCKKTSTIINYTFNYKTTK